jgi:hypothetical protein
VKPGGKGVPGGTIGLGADSQKKFPPASTLDLRNKEVVIGRQVERRGEGNSELHFLASDPPLPPVV